MGAEFLKKRNQGYEKHIDRKRASLATGDLLTKTPNDQPRRAIAKVKSDARIAQGDKLIIERDGDRLTGCRGNSVVVEIDNVSATVSAIVSSPGCTATGTVEKVNSISGTAEVSIE